MVWRRLPTGRLEAIGGRHLPAHGACARLGVHRHRCDLLVARQGDSRRQRCGARGGSSRRKEMTRLHEVATGLLVATSRTDSLNSVVVVGQDGSALLVDPGWQQDELDALSAELSARSLTPVAGFATHAHHDHVLWHPGFGDVPRWASPDSVRIAGSRREEILEALGPGYRPEVL